MVAVFRIAKVHLPPTPKYHIALRHEAIRRIDRPKTQAAREPRNRRLSQESCDFPD